jgi:hypothetical protein
MLSWLNNVDSFTLAHARSYEFAFSVISGIEDLSPEKCTTVCTLLKTHLMKIIKDADTLRYVINDLAFEKGAILCISLKGELYKLIKTAEDFKNFFLSVKPLYKDIIFNLMKFNLCKLIVSYEDVIDVLFVLDVEQRKEVFNAIDDKLPEIIQNFNAFKHFFITFYSFKKNDLCKSMMENDKFFDFITDFETFEDILTVRGIKEIFLDYDVIKNNIVKVSLSKIIKNAEDLRRVVICFSPIIKNAGDLGKVLKYFSPEQYYIIWNDYWITDDKNQGLSLEQYAGKLEGFIINIWDFNTMLKSLSYEQCFSVCNIVKKELLSIIKMNENHLEIMTKDLNSLQCSALMNALDLKMLQNDKKEDSFSSNQHSVEALLKQSLFNSNIKNSNQSSNDSVYFPKITNTN